MEEDIKKGKPKSVTKKSSPVDGGLCIIDIPPQLDISSVTSFYNLIKESYLGNNIKFNASQVARITTPGVQLLMSVWATAKSRNGEFSISEPSEIFTNAVSNLGFSGQLNEWVCSNG